MSTRPTIGQLFGRQLKVGMDWQKGVKVPGLQRTLSDLPINREHRKALDAGRNLGRYRSGR